MSFILGLTGSLGSGKSYVSSLLSRYQARIICADQIAREVVQPGSEALQQISREFGNEYLLPDGSLNRLKLAELVFSQPDKRKSLEIIIHPKVREREEELIQQYRHDPFVVLDVPLLYETRADTLCDAVLVVSIDETVREQRLIKDRGMTSSQIQQRLKTQLPQDEKISKADYVIDNSGTREETQQQVEELIQQLRKHPKFK